ncbi:hypothetical protein [Caldifermentibacillus hisashii]|uniref:hypothetical protein n=1 Tax=Caldifermentibacillus hisashii TaxID=996558 RepID=UPI002DFE9FD5|nr:hypothetical protein [Caldifermentibacillus hisashii]
MVTRLFLVVTFARKTPFLATRSLLVVIFVRETPFFGDETLSRRHFEPGNATFWRRNPFSSSFLDGKLHFLATRTLLVVIFVRETPFFGDETLSRRHFEPGNATFWRRDHFSSSFLAGKCHFLVTRPLLVVIFGRKTPFFATRPLLVVIFVRETPFFGDETLSRRHFCTGNSIFW